MTVDEHVGEHDTDGLDCWCAPSYFLPCDECDVEDWRGAVRAYLSEMPTAPGCWKCTNGLIALTRAEAGTAEAPLVIVHNDDRSRKAA